MLVWEPCRREEKSINLPILLVYIQRYYYHYYSTTVTNYAIARFEPDSVRWFVLPQKFTNKNIQYMYVCT